MQDLILPVLNTFCTVSDSFVTLWTIALQAPLSMGFFRQEYWSGLPFPSPGDLPDARIEPRSPALQAEALTSEPPGQTTAIPYLGFPAGVSGKDLTCQCRTHKRQGFDPWVGNFPWRRKWQPTPVFLPGKSHGQRSLADYSPRGLTYHGINFFFFFTAISF